MRIAGIITIAMVVVSITLQTYFVGVSRNLTIELVGGSKRVTLVVALSFCSKILGKERGPMNVGL